MKLPFILLLLLSNLNITLTQESTQHKEPLSGKEAVKLLSEGTLVVRLSRFENEIEVIRAYDGEQKAKQEQERIAEANRSLIGEFEKDYSFSDVVFAYDVDLYEYLQDSTLYIFQNNQLKIDSSVVIKNPIFILSSHGNKLYKLHDKNFRLIEKPTLEFTSHHFKRQYRFFITQLAQRISMHFSKNIPVTKFNKKLWYYMDR